MYPTLNARNSSNFCLLKNTKIQNETNISAAFGRLKHLFFTTSVLRFNTSPCLCQNAIFSTKLLWKTMQNKKLCEKF